MCAFRALDLRESCSSSESRASAFVEFSPPAVANVGLLSFDSVVRDRLAAGLSAAIAQVVDELSF